MAMATLRKVRNATALALFLVTALYLDRPVYAVGCDLQGYVQDGVICEAHYQCFWNANSATEDWETINNSPRCPWFHWDDFDEWKVINFTEDSFYYWFQCYDHCPPEHGDCGTYGEVWVWKWWEGMCPGE
jgi:hypothetical protein